MFGTLPSPCGPGNATIAEGQNGDDGTLRLATANDHDNQFVAGLTQEMLDAAEAFAAWCNEQGGVRGLPIEVLDMDGHVLEAAAATERTCDEAFAMVGGGLVFDDQEFPRFNDCKMIDFAGYTVSATKATSSGMVQPLPSPPNLRASQAIIWAAETYPEAIKNTALIYADLPSVKASSEQVKAVMVKTGWTVSLELPTGATEADWTPFAQQLKDKQISALSMTGEATNFALLLEAMETIGYRPELILQETNQYTNEMIERAGSAAEGVLVRTQYAPFEEPENYPGMASYLDVMEQFNPDGKVAALGVPAMSAYLMFATAANACIDSNDGVLERECVLAEGKKITSWDGGGLHAVTNPAADEPSKCGLILEVEDGAFVRRYPKLGSADDSGDGFNCRDNGITKIPGTYGDYTSGVDPEREG